ncbi:MAG: hypothetical protein P8124_08100 [Gammaproteobacteria bacterium]
MDTVIITYGNPVPASLQDGKFLQLQWRGRQYLIFAPTASYRYHNQLLERFLSDHKLACHWSDPEHLELDTPAVEVCGGGRFRVDAAGGTLTLWDDSHAYGRFREAGLAAAIAGAGHAWSGFQITIA